MPEPLTYMVEAYARNKRGRVAVYFNQDVSMLAMSDEDFMAVGLRLVDKAMEARRLVEQSPGLVLPGRY